jgi:hypothetical protein
LRRPAPFLLTVVPDARFLRLLDGDHHRRNDGDARQHVRAQLFLEIRRFAFAPGLELEAPDAQRVRAEDELRAYLLEALDAQGRRGPGQRRIIGKSAACISRCSPSASAG